MSDLAGAGFDLLNWPPGIPFTEARQKTGGRLRLMGNVGPLDPGVRGTPAEVKAAALDVLDQAAGEPFILSLGGGVSPGMPREHIAALAEAAREFDSRRRA